MRAMLKLYYSPGACSISPHIALRESKLPFELERVDLRRKKVVNGDVDFTTINPKGYVPALVLDDGQVLTEGVAIVQYIADRVPQSRLAPPAGSIERIRLQEWLNFIATELHKGVGPLYSPLASDEYKEATKDRVAARLAYLEKGIGSKPYLLGEQFSVADGYAFYALRAFRRFAQRDLSKGLAEYQARIAERPSVKEALAAEG